jgi:hypothetical protein
MEGRGTTTGQPKDPTLSWGMPAPSGGMHMAAMVEVGHEGDAAEIEGETDPPLEVAMAAMAARTIADDPQSIQDARSRSNWPEWDQSI